MAYHLMTSDLDWLREIKIAADSKQAVGGVPISVAAKLTGFGLVRWVGSYGLTISSKGLEALSDRVRLHVRDRRRSSVARPEGAERRGLQRGLPVLLEIEGTRPERVERAL
jgi:hypothetical protein